MKTRQKQKVATKAQQPASVKPMPCKLVKEPFDDPACIYEIKWDGV